MPSPPSPALVGRAPEREAIAAALERLRTVGDGGVLALEGEAGIGKSRLLAHLAATADEGGARLLAGHATEFEADLPHAILTDALDRHLAAHPRPERLGLADPAALTGIAPSLAGLAWDTAAPVDDRHRVHRALRDLLERLAAGARGGLVLCLDDVHWADPASADALAALVRRPPEAPVLIAVASRPGQTPPALAAALGAALREARGTVLALAPLTAAEAVELVGPAGVALHARTGGNPFHLEQLARLPEDAPLPPTVAAALASEVGSLDPGARALLDAAAVTGDPFDVGLAGEVAELPTAVALTALDELLARALVRPGDAPRRFAFRHPVLRHAVYVATPGGWRLGAHGRAAAALERREAGVVQRAHHVEHAADPGDAAAAALLRAAAQEQQALAPATAARYYAAALRILPGVPDRPVLERALADAQAASGDPEGARATLLTALATARPGERLALTVALANQEWWLGDHEDARRRLYVALADLPAEPSPDRIRLRLALALTALLAADLDDTDAQARDARADARALGEPAFEVAALASRTLASVSRGDGAAGEALLVESSAALDRLTVEQLATRLPALWMHGRARRSLGRFEAALADFERGGALAASTGRTRVTIFLTTESVPVLIELGRLRAAIAAGEEAVELARLAANPRMELWAQSALALARLAAGDVAAALRDAGEAAASGTRPDFHAAGQPGWALGAALTAAGNADRAVGVLLDAFGGPELERVLPVDRPAASADLALALVAAGDVAGAGAALDAVVTPGSGWAAAVAGVARAAVLLAAERADEAGTVAAAARDAAAGAPLAHARAQLAEGRALAAAGSRRAAVDALTAAEAALDGFGAIRLRDEAVRELRRLGHRVVRAAREGEPAEGALTVREREIAGLVAHGRTNREIAAQLVLSQRTVEAHLRNVFGKLGVRSRVELARALNDRV